MPVVDLYTGIYQTLANDTEILNLLGLDDTATELDKNKRLQKRSIPQELASNIPLIAFYTPGGAKDPRNDKVFGSTFFFEVYTSDDVELAQTIAQRIYSIFVDEIPEFSNIETYETAYEDEHEARSNLPNTYCYSIILTFFITLPMVDC